MPQPSSIEDVKDDLELEPFFGTAVAAELCGTTEDNFYMYIYRYCQHLEPHYINDGTRGRGHRVFYRSEVIAIRKQMMSGKQRQYYRIENKKYVNHGKKRSWKFEAPSYDFLTSK